MFSHLSKTLIRSLNRSRAALITGQLVISSLILPVTLHANDLASERTSIGGYGELHLNYSVPETGTKKPAQFDFHRFVLFFSHQFNSNWSFNSELELEHNFVEGNKKSGYLILEQAYVQYAPSPLSVFRAGVLLYPIGLINEMHEPTTFSTVERPVYHSLIIPTTWFGAGAAVGGDILNTIRYDILLTEGLDDRNFGKDNQGIRGARQKGFYSKLDNLLGTLRLDYTGTPGFRVGGSVSINQQVSESDTAMLHKYNRAVLAGAHALYTANGFRSSAEFINIGYSAIEGRGGDLETTQGLTAELGYDISRFWNSEELQLFPFIRYSRLNAKGALNEDDAFTRFDTGFALNPIRQVALKADIGFEMHDNSDQNKTHINAGVGYEF